MAFFDLDVYGGRHDDVACSFTNTELEELPFEWILEPRGGDTLAPIQGNELDDIPFLGLK